MIGPLCGGSQARWSDDVEENGVIDISVLANISRDRSRTCGSRIHSGLREKCPQIVAHRSLPGSRSCFTTEAGSD